MSAKNKDNFAESPWIFTNIKKMGRCTDAGPDGQIKRGPGITVS